MIAEDIRKNVGKALENGFTFEKIKMSPSSYLQFARQCLDVRGVGFDAYADVATFEYYENSEKGRSVKIPIDITTYIDSEYVLLHPHCCSCEVEPFHTENDIYCPVCG